MGRGISKTGRSLQQTTNAGYEISFVRYFYRPVKLRELVDIRRDILTLEQQSEGLLHKIVGGA